MSNYQMTHFIAKWGAIFTKNNFFWGKYILYLLGPDASMYKTVAELKGSRGGNRPF